MRGIVLVCVVMVVVVQLCNYAKAAPHKSVEEDDDSSSSDETATSTETVSEPTPIVIIVMPGPSKHEGHSHEVKSREETGEENSSEDETEPREVDESNEDYDTVKHPKTESLCPARPEEITKIEAECAKEFKEWKERRAKKLMAETTTVGITTEATTEVTTTATSAVTSAATSATTSQTTSAVTSATTSQTTSAVTSATTSAATSEVNTVATSEVDTEGSSDVNTEINTEETIDTTCDTLACEMEAFDALIEGYRNIQNQKTLVEVMNMTEVGNSSHEDIEMSTLDPNVITDETATDMDVIFTTELPDETTTTTTMAPTTSTMMTTMRPIRRNSKHKRSTKNIRKKKVRSCYPATCILRKLNLLDNMSQPSIALIQSFAVNMTVDETTNLEEKAVGCVKEINEAMIDASGDFGRKVGCIAQKVITCLNKGLTCPIMKVPQ